MKLKKNYIVKKSAISPGWPTLNQTTLVFKPFDVKHKIKLCTKPLITKPPYYVTNQASPLAPSSPRYLVLSP